MCDVHFYIAGLIALEIVYAFACAKIRDVLLPTVGWLLIAGGFVMLWLEMSCSYDEPLWYVGVGVLIFANVVLMLRKSARVPAQQLAAENGQTVATASAQMTPERLSDKERERLAALYVSQTVTAEQLQPQTFTDLLSAGHFGVDNEASVRRAASKPSAKPHADKPKTVFRISRADVMDKIEEMADDAENYPALANIRLRQSRSQADVLYARNIAFAVMVESKAGILKFFGRLNPETADRLLKAYPSAGICSFQSSYDWCKVIIDRAFSSKAEVFGLLDEWYAHALKTYFTFNADTRKYEANTGTVYAEEKIVGLAAEEIAAADAGLDRADDDLLLLEESITKRLKFEISKSIIAARQREKFGNTITVSTRAGFNSAGVSLADTYFTERGIKFDGTVGRTCYAYVYTQKSGGIKIIVKLQKQYSARFIEIHPQATRSQFPGDKQWYVFLVDATFGSLNEVLDVLEHSKTFIESPWADGAAIESPTVQ